MSCMYLHGSPVTRGSGGDGGGGGVGLCTNTYKSLYCVLFSLKYVNSFKTQDLQYCIFGAKVGDV